jgi:hypothetical protein
MALNSEAQTSIAHSFSMDLQFGLHAILNKHQVAMNIRWWGFFIRLHKSLYLHQAFTLHVFYSSTIYIQYIQASFNPVSVQQIMLYYLLLDQTTAVV